MYRTITKVINKNEFNSKSLSKKEIKKIISVEAIEDKDEYFVITIESENFENLIMFLENRNYEIESSEISLIPESTVKIDSSNSDVLLKLLDLLDENEDVQKVYSNFEFNNNG